MRTLGVLVAALVALAAPSTAHACQQWAFPGGDLKVEQSNGYTLFFYNVRLSGAGIAGRARHNRLNPGISGGFDGRIAGSFLNITVYWPGGTAGVYQGRINRQGRVEGTTYDRARPTSRATWYSDEVLICVRP